MYTLKVLCNDKSPIKQNHTILNPNRRCLATDNQARWPPLCKKTKNRPDQYMQKMHSTNLTVLVSRTVSCSTVQK